jgi:hypothetical protein
MPIWPSQAKRSRKEQPVVPPDAPPYREGIKRQVVASAGHHNFCRRSIRLKHKLHKTTNEYLGLIEREENGPPRACANWAGPSSGQ